MHWGRRITSPNENFKYSDLQNLPLPWKKKKEDNTSGDVDIFSDNKIPHDRFSYHRVMKAPDLPSLVLVMTGNTVCCVVALGFLWFNTYYRKNRYNFISKEHMNKSKRFTKCSESTKIKRHSLFQAPGGRETQLNKINK